MVVEEDADLAKVRERRVHERHHQVPVIRTRTCCLRPMFNKENQYLVSEVGLLSLNGRFDHRGAYSTRVIFTYIKEDM